MVKSGIALGTCVLLLSACELPVAPAETGAAGAGTASMTAKQQTVPFSGVVTGEASFDTNPRGCAAGFTTITQAEGTASHMGRTMFRSDHCLSLETGAIQGGHLVLTAANGDEIHATYEGFSAPVPEQIGDAIPVATTVVIAGGTGRFENASGTADMTGVVTFEGFSERAWAGRWEWNGTITY